VFTFLVQKYKHTFSGLPSSIERKPDVTPSSIEDCTLLKDTLFVNLVANKIGGAAEHACEVKTLSAEIIARICWNGRFRMFAVHREANKLAPSLLQKEYNHQPRLLRVVA
jgi:hypothetical protein